MKVWESQILPTLKAQKGYVDEILLMRDEAQEGVGISIWQTKADADRYYNDVFPQQTAKVSDMLSGTPHSARLQRGARGHLQNRRTQSRLKPNPILSTSGAGYRTSCRTARAKRIVHSSQQITIESRRSRPGRSAGL